MRLRIRLFNRDSFRATVFLRSTPLLTPRCISGIANLRASEASPLLPLRIASSTFRTNVRIRLTRALFLALFFAAWRIRFFTEAVVAMMCDCNYCYNVLRAIAAYRPLTARRQALRVMANSQAISSRLMVKSAIFKLRFTLRDKCAHTLLLIFGRKC